MVSESIQLNGIFWSVFRMSESSYLHTPDIEEDVLNSIHKTSRLIEGGQINSLVDIIPAYDSITLIFNSSKVKLESILSNLSKIEDSFSERISTTHEISVCYEKGLDWEDIKTATGLSKSEIVSIHTSSEYTVAMIGFLPGFIFLEGLDERIHTPRKSNPRIAVPKGSVGIGGSQTGLYSLESPGGWQILGRTPQEFFDVEENPPSSVKAGDTVRFISISEELFIKQESESG